PYGHRRRVAVPHRASGHGQARAGRARDGARPRRQRRGPLGERRRWDRRRAAPGHAQAAAARGTAQRGSHRARHGDAGRRADAARRPHPAAASHEHGRRGVRWGELLYSATLRPGDEAKLVVLDGRWRREGEGRERPLQILARMVGTSMLGDLVTALRPELQLDALTLTEPGLDAAAADTVQMVRDRTERMSNALRRRPLGVVDAPADAPVPGAVRTVRNT